MSSLRYKGQLVSCCCENCLSALGQINGKIKCAATSEFNHPMYECEQYEFSWRRFEEGGQMNV